MSLDSIQKVAETPIQNKNFTGAGILLYDYHPTEGVPIFLLGKEYRLTEPAGKSRHGTYSEFGGHANEDEDPIKTALRECGEETMGVISIKREKDAPLESYGFREYPKTYYIFLIRYSFKESEEIIKKYNEQFKIALEKGLIPETQNGLYEKSEFRWFKIPEIIKEKDSMRKPFYYNFLQIVKTRFAPHFVETVS